MIQLWLFVDSWQENTFEIPRSDVQPMPEQRMGFIHGLGAWEDGSVLQIHLEPERLGPAKALRRDSLRDGCTALSRVTRRVSRLLHFVNGFRKSTILAPEPSSHASRR